VRRRHDNGSVELHASTAPKELPSSPRHLPRRHPRTTLRPFGTEADLGAQIDAKRPQFSVIDEAGSSIGTAVFAGISQEVETFWSMTENRGVPGSSPGLAIRSVARFTSLAVRTGRHCCSHMRARSYEPLWLISADCRSAGPNPSETSSMTVTVSRASRLPPSSRRRRRAGQESDRLRSRSRVGAGYKPDRAWWRRRCSIDRRWRPYAPRDG
jgi:hypothetical protein